MKPYYEADGITIYHGDCLDVIREITDGAIATVFTDPPYSSGARQSAQMRARGSMRRADGPHGRGRWFNTDNLTAHGFAMLVRLLMVELLRVVSVDGHLFSFIDWRQWPVLAGVTESAGWSIRSCLVWDKMHFGMGNGFRQQAEFVLHASKGVADNFVRHDLGTVFRAPRHSLDAHPTMKPEAVVQEMLSAVPPGPVLDPFIGSGSMLVAARVLDRSAVGIDNTEQNCEVAANRLSQGVLNFDGAA